MTLLLCVEPKPVPVIVTEVPGGPEVGEMEVTVIGLDTVNVALALVTPETVTVRGPVVVPVGTKTLMAELLQLVTVPVMAPLN